MSTYSKLTGELRLAHTRVLSQVFQVCLHLVDSVANCWRVVNHLRTTNMNTMSTAREQMTARFVARREALGMSQSELSRRLGQSRGTVFNWESGRNIPEPETMIVVAKILGTSISYLYGETDDPRPAPLWGSGLGAESADEAAILNVIADIERARAGVASLLTRHQPVQPEIEVDAHGVNVSEQARASISPRKHAKVAGGE